MPEEGARYTRHGDPRHDETAPAEFSLAISRLIVRANPVMRSFQNGETPGRLLCAFPAGTLRHAFSHADCGWSLTDRVRTAEFPDPAKSPYVAVAAFALISDSSRRTGFRVAAKSDAQWSQMGRPSFDTRASALQYWHLCAWMDSEANVCSLRCAANRLHASSNSA